MLVGTRRLTAKRKEKEEEEELSCVVLIDYTQFLK
jgi:hypothetical protein